MKRPALAAYGLSEREIESFLNWWTTHARWIPGCSEDAMLPGSYKTYGRFKDFEPDERDITWLLRHWRLGRQLRYSEVSKRVQRSDLESWKLVQETADALENPFESEDWPGIETGEE